MSELSASRPSALPLAGASGPLPREDARPPSPRCAGDFPREGRGQKEGGGGRKSAPGQKEGGSPVHAPATVSRHPFAAPYQGAVPEGETLAQFVARCVAGKHLSLAEARSAALEITVHGTAIPRVLWHRVRPKAGALVLVRIRQSGGGSGKKNPLRTILQLLVVIAVSAISGGALAPYLGAAFEAGQIGAIVAAGVASIALNALVNAIAPIPQPQLGERSQSYTLSGSRNAADPYGPCVMTLGRMRVTPKLAMRPFTRAYNDDTVLYMLFQWHVGKCELSEIKIGDTPIGDFQDVTIEHRLAGEPYADEITLIPNLVIENPDISIELKNVDGWHVRAFPKNSTGLSLDLVLPGGLNQQKDGKTQNRTIVVDAEYRLVGAGSWTKVPTGASPHMSAAGRFTLTANKTSAIRRSLVWDGASGAGDYEVRVMRVSDDNRPVTVSDDIYWMGVRGDRPGAPVLDDSLCLTAVRIVASGQLNGVIDQLNAIVEPIMPVWSGGTWTTEAKTRNPAALFRWLHTGQAISAADRLSESELDGAALADWYDYCVTKGLTCDHVFDYPASVEEAAQLTAACGYATAAWAMGKRTAVIDDVKLPTQLFTSETVRGFRGRIAYLDEVHALRCLFANAAAGYKPDEIIVYADGYDSTTATKFQQAEIPGKTSASDVWKAGRRLLKRAAIRRIGYEFEIDTECLVSRYGQRVLVEHFALHREAMSARIEALVLTSGEVTGVTLSETVTMEHGATYGLQVRRGADGTLPLFDVVNPATIGVPWSGATLTFTGAALEAFEPAVGDLVVWGRSAATVEDVSLVRLAPANDEFTATVFAVPYDEDLFSGDGASAPAHVSAINGQSAGGLVLNPVRPFTALEARLTAMLGDISAAAGDGVLTPAEKVGLVPQLKQLITTEAALVARAGALGITAEKTAFEAAMTTLNAYLATLTTDVAWDDQSGNTDVTGATLIADYRAALEKQIALQDAIDAANDNALVGVGGNACVNSEFENGVVGWTAAWDGNTGFTPARGRNAVAGKYGALNVLSATISGTPANGTVFDCWAQAGWSGSAPSLADLRRYGLSGVKAGDLVFASALYAYENLTAVQPLVLWWDKDGAYISPSYISPAGGTANGATDGAPENFTEIGGFVTAPTNAAIATHYTRAYCNGSANPKAYMARPMLARVPAGQTAWPQYSPGPSDKQANATEESSARGLLANALIANTSGSPRQILNAVGTYDTYDGQSVTFPIAYAVPPKVRAMLGGKVYDSTLNNSQYRDTSFVVSTTGFTVIDKLKEAVGTVTPQTQSTWTTVSANRSECEKPTTADAWNNLYTIAFTARVYRIYVDESYYEGSVTLTAYTDDGGGWVARGSVVLTSSDTAAGYEDIAGTITFTAGALGQHAGREFALEITSESNPSSQIQSMGDLTYGTATAPASAAGSTVDYPIRVMAFQGAEI